MLKIFLLGLSGFSFLYSQSWYHETLYKNYEQRLKIDRVIYSEKTPYQDLVIFENERFGRVLALDGVVQLTQKDEYVYHEMMTHVPLVAHGQAKKVLIIGGGDGGILREVLKHKSVERVVLVEIDPSVIAIAQKYFPMISLDAFEDQRVEIIIQDGSEFVKNAKEKFDVILCDSTDPDGPGEVLFSSDFYQNCHNLLHKGGIFVHQNGVPFMQKEEWIFAYLAKKDHFQEVSIYFGVIPTYIGGFMAFGWASDQRDYQKLTKEEIQRRIENIEGSLNYYNVDIHQACFAQPQFVKEILKSVAKS